MLLNLVKNYLFSQLWGFKWIELIQKQFFSRFIVNVSSRWELENKYHDDILLSFGPSTRPQVKFKIYVSAKLLTFYSSSI